MKMLLMLSFFPFLTRWIQETSIIFTASHWTQGNEVSFLMKQNSFEYMEKSLNFQVFQWTQWNQAFHITFFKNFTFNNLPNKLKLMQKIWELKKSSQQGNEYHSTVDFFFFNGRNKQNSHDSLRETTTSWLKFLNKENHSYKKTRLIVKHDFTGQNNNWSNEDISWMERWILFCSWTNDYVLHTWLHYSTTNIPTTVQKNKLIHVHMYNRTEK